MADKETYAATLAVKMFQLIMALATKHNLKIKQFDISNAFLKSNLTKRNTYMKLPKEYINLKFLRNNKH